MDPAHRKTIKHIHEPGHVHALTFSCYRRMPLLTNDVWRGLLAESVQRATQRHRYRLVAFVFMPEHVHWLIYPQLKSDGESRCAIDSSHSPTFPFGKDGAPVPECTRSSLVGAVASTLVGASPRRGGAKIVGSMTEWHVDITSFTTRTYKRLRNR